MIMIPYGGKLMISTPKNPAFNVFNGKYRKSPVNTFKDFTDVGFA